MVLLDTNVIPELIQPDADEHVFRYVDRMPVEAVYTAAVCEAEIRYGLARLSPGRRRDDLAAWIGRFFNEGFADRVLRFDRVCATLYGEIRQVREAVGRPISVEDAMIAATARAYGLNVIATRNTKDFEACGVTVVDPWAMP